MDRSDNPGNVEREMDEAPVERENMGGGMDRDAMQGGGSVERDGVQRTGGTEREGMGGGGSVEREGMQGTGGMERDGVQGSSIDRDVMEGRGNDGMMPATNADGGTSDQMMRADQREGGMGYDRPVDTTPARDMDPMDRSSGGDRMHGSPTDARPERSIGDQGRKTTGEGISRDW